MDSELKRVFAPTDAEVLERHRPPFTDYPNAVKVGSTAHFEIYYDPSLGSRGKSIAEAVRSSCGRDYRIVRKIFDDIEPAHLPFRVVIARLPETERAYHYGCTSTTFYCDTRTMPAVDPRYSSFLLTDLLVEVFEATQGRGWKCNHASGEALGRVIATSLYPRQIHGFATASVWLDAKRRDNYLDTNLASDVNPLATGCCVLFLNYLHHQLGHSWSDIVSAAGANLSETYRRLTGKSGDPFPAFQRLMAERFPHGKPSGLATDNPFPMAGAKRPKDEEELKEQRRRLEEPEEDHKRRREHEEHGESRRTERREEREERERAEREQHREVGRERGESKEREEVEEAEEVAEELAEGSGSGSGSGVGSGSGSGSGEAGSGSGSGDGSGDGEVEGIEIEEAEIVEIEAETSDKEEDESERRRKERREGRKPHHEHEHEHKREHAGREAEESEAEVYALEVEGEGEGVELAEELEEELVEELLEPEQKLKGGRPGKSPEPKPQPEKRAKAKAAAKKGIGRKRGQ